MTEMIDEQQARADAEAPTVIPADPVLDEHAEAIRALGKRAFEHAVADIVEIDRRLTDARERCGHGGWLPWLEREFRWSRQTADNFMNVYATSGKVPNFGTLNLPISALYLLAAPSTPGAAMDEVLARAQSGEAVPVAEVRQVIERHKTKHGRKTPSTATAEKPPDEPMLRRHRGRHEDHHHRHEPATRTRTPLQSKSGSGADERGTP